MASTTSTPEIVASPTLLFRVGRDVYGCGIADAQEIIPLRSMTRLPGAPAFVRGLINMRGTIVTVLDLGQRFEPSRAPIEIGSIVLVRYRERLVGVVVDEVMDVRLLDVDEETDEEADERGAARGAIVRGVGVVPGGVPGGVPGVSGEDEGHTMVVLDLDALINQVLLS